MTVDRVTRAVREQLGLGRLLPLGGAEDRAWIMEHAAAGVLRGAAAGVDGVLLRSLRIEPADVDEVAGTPASSAPPASAPVPPGALPPGPLRITADFEATPHEPLPVSADRLREVLARTADERIGLGVTAVDLRVTALLDEAGRTGAAPPQTDDARDEEEARLGDSLATAAASVPGVVRLSPWLGGGEGVRIRDVAEPAGRHVQVQITVDSGCRTVDVARAVRDAVAAAAGKDAPGPVAAAVVVAAIE